MAIRAYIVSRGLAARGFGSRGMTAMFNQAMKDAMAEAGEFWMDKLRPIHFERRAYSRYRYTFRTVGYEAKKRRRFGHNDPLNFTGRSKREILAHRPTPNVLRRAGILRVEIPIVAPTYFFQYNPRNLRIIYKAAELVRLSQDELNFLAKFVDQRLTYHLNKYRYLRSVRRVA